MTEYLELRESVLAANLALPAHGLIKLTWGNVSEIDRDLGVIAIKPSGVSNVIDGEQSPSTDTPTHVALYQAFEEIGAVVHTHSTWATVFAQAQREIPLYGTTHADLCAEPIPVTRALTEEEIEDGYELHTGTILIEEIARFGPERLPCALVRGHAPFIWGATAVKAIENAVALEQIAEMAFLTAALEPTAPALDAPVRQKHHDRKHGPNAYYGQR
jgi:L-ribulose-5-phosphate 4-epimerase